VRVVRDKGVKAVTLEKAGVKLKGQAFELKANTSVEVVVKIPL
jgi:hypothetical protein